jgi:NADH pyrophosphatase NudC (nudix superfamily)
METLIKLTKLKDLLDSNAISVDEYNRMKANVIASQLSEADPVRKFCGSCGAPMDPGTAFCVNCGASMQRGRTASWAAKA